MAKVCFLNLTSTTVSRPTTTATTTRMRGVCATSTLAQFAVYFSAQIVVLRQHRRIVWMWQCWFFKLFAKDEAHRANCRRWWLWFVCQRICSSNGCCPAPSCPALPCPILPFLCLCVCVFKLFVLFILNFTLLKFIVSVQARLDGFIWHTHTDNSNRFSLPRLRQVVLGFLFLRLVSKLMNQF